MSQISVRGTLTSHIFHCHTLGFVLLAPGIDILCYRNKSSKAEVQTPDCDSVK